MYCSISALNKQKILCEKCLPLSNFLLFKFLLKYSLCIMGQFQVWRRKWQPIPVFLPEESQGRRSLVGCCLWGCTELDTTEATQEQQQFQVHSKQIQLYMCIFFQIFYPNKLLQDIEYSSPFAIHQVLGYLFYMQQCVCFNLQLLIFPSFSFPFHNHWLVFHLYKSTSVLDTTE